MPSSFSRYTLSRDFLFFAGIFVAIMVLACIVMGLFLYRSYKKELSYALTTESERIDRTITETFEYTNKLLVYMGKQIVEHNTKDMSYIYNLFQKNTKGTYDAQDIFSWSLFDWVDAHNLQRVNSKTGIATSPLDMSAREYTWKCPKNPWTLQLSYPTIGHPSGMWVIPAGTGVINHKGEYVGAIVIGFNIAQLTAKVEKALGRASTSFVVLDEHRNIVLHSADVPIPPSSDFFKKLNLSIPFATTPKGLFSSPLTYQDTQFTHYHRIEDYPYLILAGYNNAFLAKEFQHLFLPRIVEFTIIGTIALLLLYFFRKKLITPVVKLSAAANTIITSNDNIRIPRVHNSFEMYTLAKTLIRIKAYKRREDHYKAKLETSYTQLREKTEALDETNQTLSLTSESKKRAENYIQIAEISDQVREAFAQRIHFEMEGPITALQQTIQYLTMHWSNLPKRLLTQKEILQYLRSCYQNTLHLQALATDNLSLSMISPFHVLSECITIHQKTAFSKEVEINRHISPDIPEIYVDETKFKQIFVGLLSHVLDFIPHKGIITLHATTKRIDHTLYLTVKIKDNGMGLPFELRAQKEHIDHTHKLGGKLDGTHASPTTIENLIRLHKGSIFYEDISGMGSTIKVTLPYRGKEANTSIKEADNNIIKFNPSKKNQNR